MASHATTYNFFVTPDDLATGKPEFSQPHGTGNNPFGWDWDVDAPLGSTQPGPAGYGSSSFYGSVDSSSGDSADRYLAFRLAFRDIVGTDLQIGDIASISYHTYDPSVAVPSWHLAIYTTTGTGADGASWYGSRLQARTSDALNANYQANTWNQWSTDAGTNQLQFYDSTQPGFGTANLSWSELAGGTVTRGLNSWDFSGETIQYVNFQLGYNGGGWIGESYLDGIRIELTNGDVINVDLGVVPEPATMSLLGIGLGGLALRRLRKRS